MAPSLRSLLDLPTLCTRLLASVVGFLIGKIAMESLPAASPPLAQAPGAQPTTGAPPPGTTPVAPPGIPQVPVAEHPDGVTRESKAAQVGNHHPQDYPTKHGSGASGSSTLASVGHRGPGSVVPPTVVAGAAVGRGFYRPRGDEHDPEHSAKRPPPRDNWVLVDVPLPETDAMRNPELTRELRQLRHHVEADRPYLHQLYHAGINHAIKLDIHSEFLQNIAVHLDRIETTLVEADQKVAMKNEDFASQNTAFSRDLGELRNRCGMRV